MTTVFTSKLDRLCETIALAAQEDHRGLAAALQACSTKPVVAIGSGGSVIAAEFLAACRNGLGHSPTSVATPMAYVLESTGASRAHVWLFSASGENQDILAAFDAAAGELGLGTEVVTSSAEGELSMRALAAARALQPAPLVHVAPVADPKDGFVATHSLVSMAVSLVLGADLLTAIPSREERGARLLEDAARCLSTEARANLRLGMLARLADRDTLFLLHDPHLTAAAMLIETCFWETGVCAVQRTDFRNFAHGRHVWLARHPDRTFVLALTCDRSRATWRGIREELPTTVATGELDFGRAGRSGLLEALLTCFTVVEAGGALKGVDPGKPGVGDFGRRIFNRSDLRATLNEDDASTRRKRRAEARIDPPGRKSTNWPKCRDKFTAGLAATEIRGVIIDYDGTMVATADRLDPPRQDIVNGLVKLADTGVLVGVATGRGGSVGEMLREHVPAKLHGSILLGYYNGGHIVPLGVDIEKHPPRADAAIAVVHARLAAEVGLFLAGWLPKRGRVQITIPFEQLVAVEQGIERIAAIVDGLRGEGPDGGPSVRWLRSGHSVDIIPAWAGKLRVVEEGCRVIGDASAAVLRIGDSGDCQGNDYELLGGAFGLSVDRVCHRDKSCWNLLPLGFSGPDGLARILLALKPLRRGVVRLSVSDLCTV